MCRFFLGNGLKAVGLIELRVAECTRLTGCLLVDLGLLQPQSSSWCVVVFFSSLHIGIHTRLVSLRVRVHGVHVSACNVGSWNATKTFEGVANVHFLNIPGPTGNVKKNLEVFDRRF